MELGQTRLFKLHVSAITTKPVRNICGTANNIIHAVWSQLQLKTLQTSINNKAIQLSEKRRLGLSSTGIHVM